VVSIPYLRESSIHAQKTVPKMWNKGEHVMKVWWVVAWDNYYPREELNNVIATYYTEQMAIAFKNDVKKNGHYIDYEYNGEKVQYTMTYDHVEVINVSDKLGINIEDSNEIQIQSNSTKT